MIPSSANSYCEQTKASATNPSVQSGSGGQKKRSKFASTAFCLGTNEGVNQKDTMPKMSIQEEDKVERPTKRRRGGMDMLTQTIKASAESEKLQPSESGVERSVNDLKDLLSGTCVTPKK